MQGCSPSHKLQLTQRSNHREAAWMFQWFEDRLKPTEIAPQSPPPRDGEKALLRFYWHYARQAKMLFVALFGAGLAMALVDTLIPIFIGRVVTLVSTHDAKTLVAEEWPQLLGMALMLMIGRPTVILLRSLITGQAIVAGLTNMIRWQSHWHVVRQSWSYFQNDFAGRIGD